MEASEDLHLGLLEADLAAMTVQLGVAIADVETRMSQQTEINTPLAATDKTEYLDNYIGLNDNGEANQRFYERVIFVCKIVTSQ